MGATDKRATEDEAMMQMRCLPMVMSNHSVQFLTTKSIFDVEIVTFGAFGVIFYTPSPPIIANAFVPRKPNRVRVLV